MNDGVGVFPSKVLISKGKTLMKKRSDDTLSSDVKTMLHRLNILIELLLLRETTVKPDGTAVHNAIMGNKLAVALVNAFMSGYNSVK